MTRPPRLARWLLDRVLPRDGRAASIAGDLLEEFNATAAARSPAYASRRYWRHALSIVLRYGFTQRRTRRSIVDIDNPRRASMLGDVLRNDLRHAIRSLIKNPGFALVAVLTLAVGVGANTAIFSVLHAVVLRDLPYRDADRLAVLWSLNIPQNQRDGTSYLNFRDWKEQSRAFDDMAVYRRPEFTLGTITSGDDPDRIHLAMVGPGFFDVLGALPLVGRTLGDNDFDAGDRQVVISHALWRQRFAADSAVVGRSIEIDGAGCTIVGVMPADFAFPNADVQAWRPLSAVMNLARAAANPESRDGDPLVVIGRLSPGATFDSARAELDIIAARLREAHPNANAGRGVVIEPLTEHLLGPRTERSLWLLLGAVGFVLLIACANVANLALARGAARYHELSLRTALGASRWRLLRQSLTENLVLVAFAAAAGLVFAWLAAVVLRTWASSALPRLETVRLDATVIWFALAVSLCGALASLLPALQLSTTNPMSTIGDGGARALGGSRSRRLRQGLVVSEITLAVILVSGAGLLIRSFLRVQETDRGFDSAHVLLLQVDLPQKYDGQAGKAEYFRNAFERIRALPGVVAAGAIDDFFIRRHGDMRVVVEGQPRPRPEDAAPRLIRDRVIPGYFEAAGIPLLSGRLLQDRDLVADLDREQPQAVVINEAMARHFWPGENPVGRRLTYGTNPGPKSQWVTVVGVVADMRREKLDEPAFPCIFWPGFGPQMDIVVRTVGDPAALGDAIRAELLAVDPAVPPYGIISGEQRLSKTVAIRTLQTLLLAALAAAALALAVIGVYGLIHHSVVSRTQEIGLRMALGASNASVLQMILWSALRLTMAGLTLGLIGAVALGRTIAAFLYDTSPLDALTFVAVPALLVVAAIIGCLAPACRAARIDPIVALRAE